MLQDKTWTTQADWFAVASTIHCLLHNEYMAVELSSNTAGVTSAAPKLPLNLLDALRDFNRDKDLKAAMGNAFSEAYLKMKHQEWNAYASHFSQWEKDNTLDI